MASVPAPSSDGDEALCLECGEPLSGKFCSQCGAKSRPPLRPLRHWLTDLGRQVAVLDIRLLRTLPRLFFSPGTLTVEYSAGRRRPYTSGIRLYVAASAVVIAAMNFLGSFEIETMFTDEQIALLEQQTGISELTDPAFQARFNRSLDTVFPLVNLLSPLAIMLLLKLLYWRRYLQEHLAFGCHFGTFLVFVTTPLLLVKGVALQIVAAVVTITLLLYLLIAMRRVYGGGWVGLVARLVCLTVGLLLFILVESNVAFLIALIAALS